jgi:hypothetical protein
MTAELLRRDSAEATVATRLRVMRLIVSAQKSENKTLCRARFLEPRPASVLGGCGPSPPNEADRETGPWLSSSTL